MEREKDYNLPFRCRLAGVWLFIRRAVALFKQSEASSSRLERQLRLFFLIIGVFKVISPDLTERDTNDAWTLCFSYRIRMSAKKRRRKNTSIVSTEWLFIVKRVLHAAHSFRTYGLPRTDSGLFPCQICLSLAIEYFLYRNIYIFFFFLIFFLPFFFFIFFFFFK